MTWTLLAIICAGWFLLGALLAPALGIGMHRADALERCYRPMPGSSAVLLPPRPAQPEQRVLDRAARRR